MKAFAGNDFPTIGVEEEFHLVDKDSGDLVGCVDEVMRNLDDQMRQSVSHELYLSVLEHQSPVCLSADDLLEEVTDARLKLARACEKAGALLAAAGSHPFADWREQTIVPSEHYNWVVVECDYVARRMIAFGLHVHVGMKTEASAIYAMYEMRRWAYPLLALSANSPYFEGGLSGFASTRTHIFGSMPRTCLPPEFEDMAELEGFYDKLMATGDVTAPGDLWWSIRPQPPLGTVELRVLDLPTDVKRLAALTAITQAAMAFYQDRFNDGAPRSLLNPDYLRQNRWKAMRHGLDGKIIEPETGEILPIRDQLKRLLDMIGAKAQELGSEAHIEFAKEMLEAGNEAQWQIDTCRGLGGDLRALELEIAGRTLA